jgi:hypothetical protein
MSGHRIASGLLTAALLLACTPRPTVKYSLVSGPLHSDHFDTYALQASKLQIARVSTDQAATLKARDFEIKSLPVESQTKLALEYADSPGVSTEVKISKLPNTALVSEIGVEVSDHRIEYINDAGALVKTVVSMVPFAETGVEVKTLPIEVDLSAEMAKSATRDAFSTRPVAGVLVEIGPVPKDAIELKQLTFGEKSHQFLYSACRSAKVTASLKEGASSLTVISTVKIADPAFVQTVGLPTKGKIKTHSECGVSVESEKETGLSTDLQVLSALATQAKAIKDAIEAARNDSPPPKK